VDTSITNRWEKDSIVCTCWHFVKLGVRTNTRPLLVSCYNLILCSVSRVHSSLATSVQYVGRWFQSHRDTVLRAQCAFPIRILFVAADSIIAGALSFRMKFQVVFNRRFTKTQVNNTMVRTEMPTCPTMKKEESFSIDSYLLGITAWRLQWVHRWRLDSQTASLGRRFITRRVREGVIMAFRTKDTFSMHMASWIRPASQSDWLDTYCHFWALCLV
jgi:hypothetical protein